MKFSGSSVGHRFRVRRLLVMILCLATALAARCQTQTIQLTTGKNSLAVAVNPITNKIYIANCGDNTVTVIDGATNNLDTVAAGACPRWVAVNTKTNKAYVANSGDNTVTVIDGNNNSSCTASNTCIAPILVGTHPSFLAVNPVTNKIYVSNSGSNTVTVIDGNTDTFLRTVNVGSQPQFVAVNPVTNAVYVVDNFSDTVSVLDGNNNDQRFSPSLTVAGGIFIAVNPVTNQIYVTSSSNVTVIDGAANGGAGAITATISFGFGLQPGAIAMNPSTNRIYVGLRFGDPTNALAVIDGNHPHNTPTTISINIDPFRVVVNPVTNQIYVLDRSSGIIVIDGDNLLASPKTVATAGASAGGLALNPITNKIYALDSGGAGVGTVTVIDGATNAHSTVPVGTAPEALAVNPATNKIYVANGNNTVTVIDGGTHLPSTVIGSGSGPDGIAVNPVTNEIYISNSGSNDLTTIDPATNTVSSLTVGGQPSAVAVNPVTNKIYLARAEFNDVLIIDPARHAITTVSAGGIGPSSVAVNPVTNKIYVANFTSRDVTVIDGDTGSAHAVGVFLNPLQIAVNPITDKIYVRGNLAHFVTVIDGSTDNVVATPATGNSDPQFLDLNPISNRTYVTLSFSPFLTVLQGTDFSGILGFPANLSRVAVNPVTNKIYVGVGGTEVVVLDGATNTKLDPPVAVGSGLVNIAVDPITSAAYILTANASVDVLTDQQVHSIPLTTTITPFPGNVTVATSPTFTFAAQSSFSPTAPTPQAVYFQLDTWQGPWQRANPMVTPPATVTFKGAPAAPLVPGTHILYGFAVDGQEASSIGLNNIVTGSIQSYVFTVISNTHVGRNVPVSLSPVTVNFSQVTFAGNTTLQLSTAAAPAGYRPGQSGALTRYDLVTDAVTAGPATVCINTPDSQGYIKPSRARMFLLNSGQDITSSISPSAASELLPASFNNAGSANPTVLTSICGQLSSFPANTTLSLAVFEPLNHPPSFAGVNSSMPVFVNQSGTQISVTVGVVGEQDSDSGDPCFVGGLNAICSDRPRVKTFLVGSFTSSSAPGNNCQAGCTLLDISSATADPAATVQMVPSTAAVPQHICVVAIDQTTSVGAVPALVSASKCIGPGMLDFIVPPINNTFAGTNVQVALSPVTVTFSQVTIAGNTSLQLNAADAPPGYRPGQSGALTRYDLVTTALTSGSLTVCVNTPDSRGFIKPSRARMFLLSGSLDANARPPDITSSVAPSGPSEILPVSFDTGGHALPTPVTNICGTIISGLSVNATISLGVFEPVNHPPSFITLNTSDPTFVVESKNQGGNEVSVTVGVAGEQDLDQSDACIIGGQNTTCSDRPNVKTLLLGFFTFSSAPGNNCVAGCDVLDISNATADSIATVQMFASTTAVPQQICVAVFDQTVSRNAVPAMASTSGCKPTSEVAGFGNFSVPVPMGNGSGLQGKSSATVTAGQAVSTTISVSGTAGTSASFDCHSSSGSPALASVGISCLLSSPVTVPDGTAPATIQLFVQTSARASASSAPGRPGTFRYGWLAAPVAGFLLLTVVKRRRGKKRGDVILSIAVTMLLGFLISCGGGSGQSAATSNTVAGTPSGTYVIVVTVTNSTNPVTLKPGDGSPGTNPYTFTLTVR